MNSLEQKIVEGIMEFNWYVDYLDSLIRSQYEEKINPVKASTSKIIANRGVIVHENNRIEYRFHGRGCCFYFNTSKVDFDYLGIDWSYEGFGIHKLHEFFKSTKKFRNLVTLDLLISTIENLEKEGVIYRVNPPSATFQLASPRLFDK